MIERPVDSETRLKNPIIRVRNLKKSFGNQHILTGVDLDIPEGSVFGIVGQSGTGKSVLFKSIMGMIRPDSGKVWYRDTELTDLPYAKLVEIRKKFGS